MDRAVALMAFVAFLLLPGMVQAACSIGANPLSMEARAVPGQTVTAAWNLYNIHGDRITHVVINVAEAPPGWEISIEPGLHGAAYNVTGVLQEIEENLGLRPTEVVGSIPDPKPEGTDYVKHPKEDGYIPVRPVDILVKVPVDAEPFKDYKVTLEAVGNCFMEPGAVVPGIATQLELAIRTISGEGFFEEEILEEPREVPEAGGEAEAGKEESTPGGQGFDMTGFLIDNAAWIGVIVVIVLAAFALKARPWERGYRAYSYEPE